jgi:hypothetical protein
MDYANLNMEHDDLRRDNLTLRRRMQEYAGRVASMEVQLARATGQLSPMGALFANAGTSSTPSAATTTTAYSSCS